MSKLIGRLLLLLVLAVGWTGSASAIPIIVDGREWLQPADFDRLSWNDVSTVCDATNAACTGAPGSIDVTGYTWASVDEVNALFNFFLPGDPVGPRPEQSFPGGSFYPLLLSAGFITTSLPEQGLRTYVAGVTRSVIPNLPGRVYFAIAGNYHGGLNEP